MSSIDIVLQRATNGGSEEGRMVMRFISVCCLALFAASINFAQIDSIALNDAGFVRFRLYVPKKTSARSVIVRKEARETLPSNLTDYETSHRGGARIDLVMHDENKFFGDLLSVSDTAIIVYIYKDLSYAPTERFQSGPFLFRFEDIDRVILNGKSRILEGMFIGLVGGFLGGTIVNRVIEGDKADGSSLTPALAGGIGLIAGTATGMLTSKSNLVLQDFSDSNVAMLKSLARYSRSKVEAMPLRIPSNLPSDTIGRLSNEARTH